MFSEQVQDLELDHLEDGNMDPIVFVVLMLLCVTAIGLYLITHHVKNPVFLAIFIPVVLALVVTFISTSDSLKNKPIAGLPENAFMFLDYTTDRKNIHVWIRQLDKPNPTTHTIPYSRKQHEQMEQAKEGMKKGKVYMGGKKLKGQKGKDGKDGEGKGNKSDFDSDGPLYEFDVTPNLPQKEGNENER